MKKAIKSNFLAGLLIVVPLIITFYILKALVGMMDSLLLFLPDRFHPDVFLPVHIPGIGVVFSIVLVLIAGSITTNFFGKKLIEFGERVLNKIPVARGIYVATKQLMETIVTQNSDSFRRAVLVEYPRKGIYSLAFVTGAAKGEIGGKIGKPAINVFIPTTPNPTSGFYLIVPEEDTIPLDMPVEDAFKMLISFGMVNSKPKGDL